MDNYPIENVSSKTYCQGYNVQYHNYRLLLSYVCCILFTMQVIILNIDTNVIVPMTEANQNFSKVVRIVDGNGMAVIMKNNKPRYLVVSFFEYDEIQAARRKLFKETVDSVITENVEALRELAK